MLKRNITYTDYSDPPKVVTETFYFNLSQVELIELDVNYLGGMKHAIEKMVASSDNKALFDEFKRLILLSYGLRSDDGRKFEKSEALQKEFESMAAFDALFIEVTSNETLMANFFNAIVPQSMLKQADPTATAMFPPVPNQALPSPPQALPQVDPYGPSGVKAQ